MSKRTITGVVSSTAGNKTITVTRTTRETHPLYGKKYTRSQKFHAHDEKNEAKVGDMVVIEESKPISRTKTWVLKEIVERGREILELKKTEIEMEVDEAERRATEHEKVEDEEVAEKVAVEKEAK
jgi:small subunit ribosomal protein S17